MNGNRFAPRVRTQRDKADAAIQRIYQVSPAVRAQMTADDLCRVEGVNDRKLAREIEVKLLLAQERERKRA